MVWIDHSSRISFASWHSAFLSVLIPDGHCLRALLVVPGIIIALVASVIWSGGAAVVLLRLSRFIVDFSMAAGSLVPLPMQQDNFAVALLLLEIIVSQGSFLFLL